MKLKDGYKKLIGTSYNGDISQVLLSNGGNLGYAISSTASTLVQRNTNGQIESSIATSANLSPFKITSTYLNTNLNADLLDNYQANTLLEEFTSTAAKNLHLKIGGKEIDINDIYATFDAEGNNIVAKYVTLDTAQTISGVKTFSSQQKFTYAGAPFTVSNSTVVVNLNADLLDGVHKEGLLTTFENINDTDHPQSIKLTVGGTTKYVQTAYSTNTNLAGILGNATDANYPLLFTSAINASTTNRAYQNIYTDTANSLYYNPSTNTLRSPNIIASTLITSPQANIGAYIFMDYSGEGIYLNSNGLHWHEACTFKTNILNFTSDGKVGIGTYTPSTKLDVSGTFNSSNYQVGGALELRTDDTTCQTTVFGSNNSGYRMRIVRQATSTNLNTQYSPTLVLSSLDTHAYIAWRYDSDSVWVGGGSSNKWNWRSKLITSSNYTSYLGYIGTTAVQSTSKAQALTGITNATLSGKLTFTTAAATASISFLNGELIDGYGNVQLGTNSASWNVFDSSRNPLLTVLKNGNVGIGTNSPSYKLHVAGDAYATGWSRAGNGFYVEGKGVHYMSNGVNGLGQIYLTSNEFNWSASGSALYFNYRASANGTTVTQYIWNAGSSSSYAKHTMGVLQTYGTIISTCAWPNIVCNNNASGANESNIRFEVGGVNKGYVGFTNTYGTYLYNSSAGKYVYINNNGYFYTQSYINVGAGNEKNASNPPYVWGVNGSDNFMRTYATSSLSVGNADTLDGYHASSFLLRGRMTNPSNGTSYHGAIPYAIALKAAGTPVYTDPEFASGNNSVNVYNNSGNSTVAISRIADNQGSANSSGYILQIVNNGGTSTPGRGGFYQNISARQNAVFAQIFRAKIPTGFSVANAENSMGSGYTTFWLTDQAGTGKWEWYIRITICGNGGTYSGGGHVYLNGSGAVTWYLAYCNLIDLTKGNYDGLRVKYCEQSSTVTVTNSDANSTYRMVWHSGNTLYSTAGIYCNPSTDYLYASSMNASNWFRSSGNTGWYNPTNECHVYPNNVSTYGGLILRGTKGSYHGFLLGTTTNYMNVMSSETHHGLYCENTGQWEFYYNRSSKAVGILTSTITKTINLAGSTYISSTLDMGGAINTASTPGTWVSGMSGAAIQYRGLSAIDATSFWRFFNMKSSGGHVVCYGGLGNDIGFYGYYSGRTANGTDWRFTVSTANGNWTATASIYAAHFYENSDIMLKTNIQEILRSDNIPTIKEFDWKEDGSHSYGLIAQELEEQGYSELVSVKDDGYKTVNYSAALSLIVGKLQVKIRELEKEIENLKNKN